MDGHRFDGFVKTIAAGGTRRRFLARFAGGASGGALTLLGLDRAGAQEPTPEGGAARQVTRFRVQEPTTTDASLCRQDGDSCGGDQLCCGGLLCSPSGKDQVTRCVSEEEPVETCAETCEPTEVKARKPRAYRVEADCRYDDAADRTTCDCAARADDARAPRVKRLTISQADVCGEVVGGDPQVNNRTANRVTDRSTNTANAGSGGEANAEASGGAVTVGDVEGNNQVAIDASGGNAQANAAGGSGNVAIAGGRGVRFASPVDRDSLRLTFAGRVEASGEATYWCETDDGLLPAIGPALARVREELTGDVGEILVRAAACDIADSREGYDWFGQCRRPAKATLRLRAQQGRRFVEQETAATDDGGRRTFRGLAAGLYRLAPEGEGWCHAECDSVDDNGDVILEAGQRTTLYVFNCNRGRPDR